MKYLLTLCFYSHPKALPDIKEWEHKFWEQVIHKEVQGDGNYLFIIQRDIVADVYEYMFCIPKDKVLGDNEYKLFVDDISKFEYLKNLYIGDFTEEEILSALEFTKEIKKRLS